MRAFSRVCNVPRKPLVSHPMGHLQLSTRRQDGRHCIFWAAKSRRPSLAHQGREGNRPWRPREGRATTPGDPRIWGRPPLVVEKYEPSFPRPCKSIRTVRSSKVGESEHDKTFSQNCYGWMAGWMMMMLLLMMMMMCLSHGDERTRSR